MRSLLSDLHYTTRVLSRNRKMATFAILTLALGIGANTAMFTIVDSVLLRPLPYAQPKSLIYIAPKESKLGFGTTSWLNYRDIRDSARNLDSLGAYSNDISVLEGKNGSQSVLAPRITPNLFTLLGARPLIERVFQEAEGQMGGPQVVLLSEALWRQSFNADLSILGRQVKIAGTPRTVVGIMPGSFRFPEEVGPDIGKGIWLPLQPTPEMLDQRGYNFLGLVGKMRATASLIQVQGELDGIEHQIRRADPTNEAELALLVTPYQDLLMGPVRPVLYGLFAGAALLLFIACANVSNMLIANCLNRQPELALRSALGASHRRLLQQSLSEGAIISLLGSALGFVFAELVMIGVHRLPTGTIPLADSIALHWTVIVAVIAIASSTTLLSSLLPGLITLRVNPSGTLQKGSRGLAGAGALSGRLGSLVVIVEVALSVLLLVGSGLLFHTLWNLQRSRLGFDTNSVTTFTAMPADAAGFSALANASGANEVPPSIATTIYTPVLTEMRSAADVVSASLTTALPLSGIDVEANFSILGNARDPANQPSTRLSAISGDYARTMGTPILQGRMVSDDDTLQSPFVVVVNETFAKKYFPQSSPVGHQLDLGGKDAGMVKPYTIVGILSDQVDTSVGLTAQPLLLLPQQQLPTISPFYQALLATTVGFAVRTHGNTPIAPEMRHVFHQTAPSLALDNFHTMQQVVDQNTFTQRLAFYLVGSFAALAVAMVITGLYGVLSQVITYRRREIGIRMALGATRRDIVRWVCSKGLVLIGAGVVAGILISFAGGRLLVGFLYQVRPLDVSTYLVAVLGLTALGVVAMLVPAWTASTIQPTAALGEDSL